MQAGSAELFQLTNWKQCLTKPAVNADSCRSHFGKIGYRIGDPQTLLAGKWCISTIYGRLDSEGLICQSNVFVSDVEFGRCFPDCAINYE